MRRMAPPRKCECGECPRCQRREYMRAYQQRPGAREKNLAKARRWYQANRPEGSPGDRKRGPKQAPLERRFWSRVDKSANCWLWTGALDEYGYGRFYVGDGRAVKAHRMAFLLMIFDPGELDVLHSCDNPRCVRPSHLFLGTQADNLADMRTKGRDRPWGHPKS
jgi:hypothetical protein